MIQLKDISKKFGSKIVLKNINLSIDSNSVYCLLGKNGAGKSTMLNILLDLVKATKGDVLIFDKTYEKSPIEIKKKQKLSSRKLFIDTLAHGFLVE